MSFQLKGSPASLADLGPGQSAQIHEIRAKGSLGLRLREMGLVPGTQVRLVRRAPMGDPIQFEVRGYQLSLRAADAGRVEVEVNPS